MRLQLALNVPDIEAAVSHYSQLFGVDPHKRRDGYANFSIEQPALKLVLFENPQAREHLNHLGVELFGTDEIGQAKRRLEAADLLDAVESETQCCHATQDKIWSRAYDGLRWEWYRVLDEAPNPENETLGRTCCTGGDMTDNMGAAGGCT